MSVCMLLSVKAVRLEPVTELTTSTFIATIRKFIAHKGIPSATWSDNRSNFVGAAKEIQKLVSDSGISDYCSQQGTLCIERKFIPEHTPHFGRLWETAVRSFKDPK